MKPHDLMPKPTLATVAAINGNFLLAAGTGPLAWACWPDNPQSWPLALLSGLLGLLALTALGRALALIVRIHRHQRQIAAMLASAAAPNAANLASAEALRRARMTDD